MRPVAASVDELVGGAERTTMIPADSKSGARFEWVVIDGERCVVKYQDARDDWLMRATGDTDGSRFVSLWEHGLLDRVPGVIDHAVMGCAIEGEVGAILLRDVSVGLLPLGDVPIPMQQHLRFLDHMAALSAEFWGWRDEIGLTSLRARYLTFSPDVAAAEAVLDSGLLVPRVMAEGWSALPQVSPRMADILLPLLEEPEPLLAGLRQVPHTFAHGDWKAANLGSHPDGRTILLDWGEVPGEAAPTAELSWYLALNAARLPQSKDDTIGSYRAALERRGVATQPWWDDAIALELLGAMVQFGWEKALGGPGPELSWWEDRVIEGSHLVNATTA